MKSLLDLDKITVIVPNPKDYSHVFGVFRFPTWKDAAVFTGKLAEQERVLNCDECETCADEGCGENISDDEVRYCDGDCGDGCSGSKRLAYCYSCRATPGCALSDQEDACNGECGDGCTRTRLVGKR